MSDTQKNSKSKDISACSCQFELAKLPECCQEQIHEFERELNKKGCWNIALVAYQKTV